MFSNNDANRCAVYKTTKKNKITIKQHGLHNFNLQEKYKELSDDDE
jgi:hypothetical protein